MDFCRRLGLTVWPIKFLKGFGAYVGPPQTVRVDMDPPREFIMRFLLNLLFLSVYVDVPLPAPFHGKAGIKMKLSSEWVDSILGGGMRPTTKHEVSLLCALGR